MSLRGMRLRSGRVLGLAPPPPPPPPPAPIPPGPAPPGLPAPNTLMGLPLHIRQNILQHVFQGLPRMDLENLNRPGALGALCLVNHQLQAEATEAFFTVCSFEVTIITSAETDEFVYRFVNWGQPPALMLQVGAGGQFQYTLQDFRRRVARAQVLSPSRRSLSWGDAANIRLMRSAGEFPWNTCRQWVQNAGPFMRDVDFRAISPLKSYFPMSQRVGRLEWNFPVVGICSVRVLPGVGANVNTVRTPQVYPPGPPPLGLMVIPALILGQAYPYWPPNHATFDGQCQRADIEARRLRQSYIPVAPPPGVPGFTGFNLRDLREIAKSFGEPSIYRIQP